jgi:hypothetical protein
MLRLAFKLFLALHNLWLERCIGTEQDYVFSMFFKFHFEPLAVLHICIICSKAGSVNRLAAGPDLLYYYNINC